MGKRTQLLPPYLENNPVWTELFDALDTLWANGTLNQAGIDNAINALRYIRYPYILTDAALGKINEGQMISFEEFAAPDRSLLIQQTNLLGLPITNSDLLSDEDYLRLFRNLGMYWFSKGKANFIDFLSYCLNTDFSIINLWTTNYVDFYEEGDPTIGTPIWSGGAWYPTTHVRLSYDAAKYTDVPTEDLTRLFYDFANYNLVLLSIDQVASPRIIADDSSLWVWGGNGTGQLGLGDLTDRSSPVQVGSLTMWESITHLSSAQVAVQSDGTLWAWGLNNVGQLGLSDTVNRSSPVRVGALTDWRSVTSGYSFVLATKIDGTLWAWGDNSFGALGTGNTSSSSSPVQVGIDTNWRYVTASSGWAMATKTDGTLWTWGADPWGNLGLGTVADRSSPVQVGLLSDWANIDAGTSHGLAVKTDGTLWAWGLANTYQLGTGNTTSRSSPVQVGIATDWKFVSAGDTGSLGIKTDNTLWVWGSGAEGQLGKGDTLDQVNPVALDTKEWRTASIGGSYTLAIDSDGALWAWGDNSLAQLGLGDLVDRSSPVQVGSQTTWKSVIQASSSAHSVALRADYNFIQAPILIIGGLGEVEETITNY
jgi:alpha-tubulin suppressor-like RCC1 family protein